MTSEKQIEANRANAQKSTGPTSELGKKRSALNGTRHGLTGQVVVLPEEDFAAFNTFMTALVATFDVVGAMELQLAQSFANYQWRINRAAAIEENLFALGNMVDAAGNLQLADPQVHNAMCNAKMFRSDSTEFGRIAMYSQRLVNQAEKVFKQLKQLQAERRHRERSEMNEAVTLYKAHRQAGEPFDPKSIGFVLTISQIELHMRRERLGSADFIAEEAARNRKKTA